MHAHAVLGGCAAGICVDICVHQHGAGSPPALVSNQNEYAQKDTQTPSHHRLWLSLSLSLTSHPPPPPPNLTLIGALLSPALPLLPPLLFLPTPPLVLVPYTPLYPAPYCHPLPSTAIHYHPRPSATLRCPPLDSIEPSCLTSAMQGPWQRTMHRSQSVFKKRLPTLVPLRALIT